MSKIDIPAKELEAEAHSLIDFVSTCTRPDELLCGWVDAQTNARDTNHLLPDFGDWAPFFLYFDRPELLEQHLRALPNELDANGILRPSRKKFGIPVVTAFEHTDLLLGLLDCARLHGAHEAAARLCEACAGVFKIGNRGVHSYYLPSLRASIPITSAADATFIELFVQASRVLNEERYLKIAEDLASYFIILPFVRQYHLFPELSGLAFGPRTRRVQTMKHNTNAVFGLLELYRAQPRPRIREALEKWVAYAPELLDENGYAYFAITRSGERWLGDKVDIIPNVGLLDALCDLAYFFKNDTALGLARSLGGKLLLLQNAGTGLVRRSTERFETHLDAQTDLIVAWEKLAELSGDERFHNAAVTLFKGIRKYHHYKGGYIQSCDSRDGKIVSYRYTTRYNSLLLKPYILYLSGSPIYENETLLQLLKDR